jgi:iron(III) transport system substrate-binding protein
VVNRVAVSRSGTLTTPRSTPAPRAVRRIVPALLVTLLVSSLTGCFSGGDDRSIVLYNGQHTELTRALVAKFEEQTGIKVRIRTNSSIVLANQILQEGGNSPADVYIAENSPELVTLAEQDALAKLPSNIVDQVPSRYNGPDGAWAGIALRVSGLVYDPDQLPRSQLPASLLDLAKPEWKGRVGVAPTDADFIPLVGAVIATRGKAGAAEWLAGIKRNAEIYQDDEAVVAAVNRGDVASGVINQYYWYRLQRELGSDQMHSNVYYFPNRDVGAIENVSGAAVLKSTGRRKDAEAFVRFLVGEAGQQVIARGDDFEYPVRPGVAPNAALPALESVAPATLTTAALGNGREASRLILAAGLA